MYSSPCDSNIILTQGEEGLQKHKTSKDEPQGSMEPPGILGSTMSILEDST